MRGRSSWVLVCSRQIAAASMRRGIAYRRPNPHPVHTAHSKANLPNVLGQGRSLLCADGIRCPESDKVPGGECHSLYTKDCWRRVSESTLGSNRDDGCPILNHHR